MNRFKRFGALILALLLVAAPCVSVLADNENLGGVVTSNPEGLTSISFNVRSKSPNGHARPAVDIGYFIEYEGETKGPIVSFADGPVVSVAEGGYDTDHTVHYEANPGETTITNVPLRINVNDAVPGLYNYHISQVISPEQKAEGFSSIDLVNPDYRDDACTQYELYLVVGNNGKVTQAVLKKGDQDSDKLTGFVVYYDNPHAPENTFSVELHKTTTTGVEGTFEFDVKIDLPTGSDPSVLDISAGGTPISSDSFTALSTTTTVSVAVGSKVEITGLPDGAKVSVREHDDGTYLVSSVVDNMTAAVMKTDTSAPDSVFTTTGTIAGGDGIITYINEKRDISLTGVSLRYAPFLAMAAVALFGFALSRRRVEDEI